MNTSRSAPVSLSYKLSLAGFIVSFSLTLLPIVDFRCGFLFSQYVQLPYAAYHPAQILLFTVGAAGVMFL